MKRKIKPFKKTLGARFLSMALLKILDETALPWSISTMILMELGVRGLVPKYRKILAREVEGVVEEDLEVEEEEDMEVVGMEVVVADLAVVEEEDMEVEVVVTAGVVDLVGEVDMAAGMTAGVVVEWAEVVIRVEEEAGMAVVDLEVDTQV
jgi:hypothetical protein